MTTPSPSTDALVEKVAQIIFNESTAASWTECIPAARAALATLPQQDELVKQTDDLAESAAHWRAKWGDAQTANDELVKALEPFAKVTDKLPPVSVIEVCEPHPDNPSPHIQPMLLSDFRQARAVWEKYGGKNG